MKVSFMPLVLLAVLALQALGGHAQQAPKALGAPMANGRPSLPGMPDGGPQMRPNATPAPNPYANATITTRLMPGAHQTHGYQVLVNGRVVIAQPSIPGQPGNEGFRTPAQAQRVADLVASKLRNNQLPPAVTAAELQRLQATN